MQVPGDGVVDDVLEQLGLGAVEGLDGLDRDPGLFGDAAHGGTWPAEALEGVFGGGHDGLPGPRRGRRPPRGVVGACGELDGIGHIR